jgi:HAD superfamily hydrolase (TIGR01509 family)
MIKAVIFDMDGLLIDSMPFWVEAEIKVLGDLGVPLTSEMTKETPSGLREDEVVKYWRKQYPWQDISTDKVAMRIEQHVADLVHKKGKAMLGVKSTIKLCLSKGLPLAIASGSSPVVIDTVMGKLDITQDITVVCSAYGVALGKPEPAVYLKALDELNRKTGNSIHAEECLVFEDSANGVTSAKSAGMKCIALPGSNTWTNPTIQAADKVLGSLEDFNEGVLELL